MKKEKKRKNYVINCPELMDEWDWEKNGVFGLSPNKLTCGSHVRVNWICKLCGKSYILDIKSKAKYKYGCKTCAARFRKISNISAKFDENKSLAKLYPDLIKEWVVCVEDETISPYKVMPGSNLLVKWRCQKCGGEYDAYIANRALKGTGCRYCSGQAVLQGKNDLQTTNPELAKEWSNKNIIKPTEITAGSNTLVFWVCNLGHEDYPKTIKQRSNGQGCPICAQQSQTSFPEQSIYFYVKKIFPDALNRFVFQKKYEIDIYIPSLKLGIEYNGFFSHKNKDIKDKEKKDVLQKNGISLIVVKEYKKEYEKNNADFYIHESTKTRDLNTLIYNILKSLYGDIDLEVNVAKDMISIKEQYVIKKMERSISNLRPDLLSEWDYNNNGKITPDLVTVGSNLKYSWICPICKESYLMSPKRKCNGGTCTKHKKEH